MRYNLINKWVEMTRISETQYINHIDYIHANYIKDECYELITKDMKKHNATKAEIEQYQKDCQACGC